MRSQKTFRFLWGISLLLMVGMACSLITTPFDKVAQLKGTAESMASAVESGREIMGTGQAFVTQIGESGIQETAQALVTEFDESGVKETVQAAVTEFDESGFQETVQAAVTEFDSGGVQETVQALATDIYVSPDEIPADIPVMDIEKSAFVGSPEAITYIVNTDFASVLTFYQREMAAQGWTLDEITSTIGEATADLRYTKGSRAANVLIVEIPLVGQVSVVIDISG